MKKNGNTLTFPPCYDIIIELGRQKLDFAHTIKNGREVALRINEEGIVC